MTSVTSKHDGARRCGGGAIWRTFILLPDAQFALLRNRGELMRQNNEAPEQ